MQKFDVLKGASGAGPDRFIIIADNEGSAEAREICNEFRKRSSIPLIYVNEPRRGISYARNACLDHVPPGCDFVAFIDDDEVPVADWLEQLLKAQAATGADIVQGPVVPVLTSGVPAWMRQPGFFGVPSGSFNLERGTIGDLQQITWAATGNALVRTAVIAENALRFDAELAFSGGEDKLFFLSLLQRGCKAVYAKEAVVYEEVSPARAKLKDMLARRFFYGNAEVLINRKISGRVRMSRFNVISAGASHLGLGTRRCLKTLVGSRRTKDRFALGAMQVAYGVGMIAGAFGYRYQHYR